MYITEAILLGLALAMDCFAVSITSGAIVKHIVLRPMLTMILSFGLFQGAMVLAGWYVSTLFSRILAPIDHWIAFGLLSAIGIQMIREGFGKKEETKFDPLSYKVILTLAVATSIDAMGRRGFHGFYANRQQLGHHRYSGRPHCRHLVCPYHSRIGNRHIHRTQDPMLHSPRRRSYPDRYRY